MPSRRVRNGKGREGEREREDRGGALGNWDGAGANEERGERWKEMWEKQNEITRKWLKIRYWVTNFDGKL